MVINAKDKKLVFSYGGEGEVYQLDNSQVLFVKNNATLKDLLSVEDAMGLDSSIVEVYFNTWQFFWEYFINKYPHWAQLRPTFHNPGLSPATL
jgi:hypothetical protein